MQEPKLVFLEEKKLVGLRMTTCLAEDSASLLWRSFMPRRKEIEHTVGQELYSVQFFPAGLGSQDFMPTTPFEKWAAVEVKEVTSVPEGLEVCSIPAGRYAVFVHKGLSREFQETAHLIFDVWLPASGFALAHRPHFEVMGSKYLGHTNPASEEDIWVPIQ